MAVGVRGTVAAAGGHAVRVGVDGPVGADGAALADAVAAALAERAVPTGRVRADDWLRSRSLRLEYGPADPDAYYEGWLDMYALRREVLDPLGPGGSGRWLARLRDPATDRSYREPATVAVPGLVVVADGPFLARWELADAFDVVVHLEVTPAAQRRRLPDDDRERVLAAWRRYLDETDPAPRVLAAGGLVVRFDHPARPALVVPDDGARDGHRSAGS
ncbi:uridine kinase [Kineosporia sp. R_H_3]|uniref:uridine kinase n=1 Tax=Kineosporia sp. R_H_3 TaxID=1961848 RepID=UPI000B4ADDD3|nr:uridine kinase [Kineosporia sp. R_H_3]